MSFTLPFTATEITAFKDIVLAFAAIGTVWYARKGINKWHDEARGKASFELAHDVLKTTYGMQREIARIRNPVHYNHEMQQQEIDTEGMPQADKVWTDKYYMYKSRSKDLEVYIEKAKAFSIEVASLWSTNESKKLNNFVNLAYELLFAVSEYVHLEKEITNLKAASNVESAGDQEGIQFVIEQMQTKMTMLNMTACKPVKLKSEYQFCKRINTAIKEIEDITKPHLKR